MITKVLDRDTSLAEKKWTLFTEQGITITSILIVIEVAISVLGWVLQNLWALVVDVGGFLYVRGQKKVMSFPSWK